MPVSRSPKQADSGHPATVGDPEVPFGRYLLRTRLASGGMADVYAAELAAAAGFRKRVAIKRLRGPFLGNEGYLQMFLAEARLGSVLSHPNLCEVYELGHAEGEYYIAMEYLHGVTLSTLNQACVGSGQQLPIPVVVGIIAQACEALHYAHEHRDIHGRPHGVIHRDVSPQNLMICDDGRVKLLDFGVAKDSGHLTGGGTLKGKPCYMSPEQLYGEQLDRRTDLWSLGVVLFECLTGTRLFRRSSSSETISAITKEPIPSVAERRAGVPPALSNVVARALSRERDWRFATALELRVALLKSIGIGACASREAIGALVRSACAPTLRARAHAFDEPPPPSTTLPEHNGRESSGTRRRSKPLADGPLADGSEAPGSETSEHPQQESSIPMASRGSLADFTIAMPHQRKRSIPTSVRVFVAGFLIALVTGTGSAGLWDLQRAELPRATLERTQAVQAEPVHALATAHEHSSATFRAKGPRQRPPLVDALKETEPSEALVPRPIGQAPRAQTIRPTPRAPRRVAMRSPLPSSFQKRLGVKPAPTKKETSHVTPNVRRAR